MNRVSAANWLNSTAEEFTGAARRHRRALAALAFLFFALSLAYVVVATLRNWSAVSAIIVARPGMLVAAAGLYAVAHLFTASAWLFGLRGLGKGIPITTGLKIGMATQVGKYLPGNVAHYLGRAGLASRLGVSLTNSGVVTLLETIAALFAAALIVSAASLVDRTPIDVALGSFGGTTALPMLGLLGAFAVAVFTLRFSKLPASSLLAMIGCLATSFVLVGLSFHYVGFAISDRTPSPAALISVFTFAWLIGFIVPGAPAGIGVRDAVLIAWLGPMIGPGPAVACTALHRIITALTDAAVAMAGYALLQLPEANQAGGSTFSKK